MIDVGELVELRSKIDTYVPAFLDKHGGYGGMIVQGTLAVWLANKTILEETEMVLVLANGRLLWVMQDDVTQA